MPRALVITPNLHEAAALLDCPGSETRMRCARKRCAWWRQARAVLIKGGHGEGRHGADGGRMHGLGPCSLVGRAPNGAAALPLRAMGLHKLEGIGSTNLETKVRRLHVAA